METANDINTDMMRTILEGSYQDAYKHLFTTNEGFHTKDLSKIDQENFQAMQDYYNVCLDEATINSLGPTPIYSDIAHIEKVLFPVSDSTTLFSTETKAWISQTMAMLEHNGISTLASMFVDADDKDPDMNAILFGQATLGLPSKEYYEDPEILEKYRVGLNDILYKTLGEYTNGKTEDSTFRAKESANAGFTLWNKDKIKAAVNRYIDFETKVANISLKKQVFQ